MFLEISQNLQENTCARVSFLIKLQALFFNKVVGLRPKACNFIKKEILAHVFSCEFCEISKNTFFTEHLWTAASLITVSENSDKISKNFPQIVVTHNIKQKLRSWGNEKILFNNVLHVHLFSTNV